MERERERGEDRNSGAIWQKVIVLYFRRFHYPPPGWRCPLFHSMEPGIFDARSVKRETMSRGGEGNNGEASRRDTTQRDFFTGGEDLSGRIKPSLSFSFILSSRCPVYSQSGCDFFFGGESCQRSGRRLMERIPRETKEEGALFSRPMFCWRH